MYKKILVALDHTHADEVILSHIQELAQIHGSRLFLVHVADGWAARNYDELQLAESEEIKEDRQYLEMTQEALLKKGFVVSSHLAMGDPPEEILHLAETEQCDLIAMTSHGHRFFADLFYGSTIEEVRHRASVPLLVFTVKEKK